MKKKGIVKGLFVLALLWISCTVSGQHNGDSIPCRSLWDEVYSEMERAFNEIDWEKLRIEMQEARTDALEALEWDEIREEMNEARRELKKELEEIEWEAVKKELQKEMKDVKLVIDSLYREIEREFGGKQPD